MCFLVYIYSIWEENEYTTPKRKFSLIEENKRWIIIIKIKRNVRRSEWRDIGMKRLTTEEFITKARSVHGEKYDYSLVNYIEGHLKIVILCRTHGKFLQMPYAHLAGKGMSKMC